MEKIYIPARKKKKIAKMLEKVEILLKEVKEELKKLAKKQ